MTSRHLRAVPDPVPEAEDAPAFLTPVEVADITSLEVADLAAPRFTELDGEAPPGIWFNGEMRYNPAAVRAWMRRQGQSDR